MNSTHSANFPNSAHLPHRLRRNRWTQFEGQSIQKLHALKRQGAWRSLGVEVAQLASQMSTVPLSHQSLPAWMHLGQLAREAGRWDVVRHTLYARHALRVAESNETPPSCQSRARLALGVADSYLHEDNRADAQQWMQQALEHLDQDQSFSYRDWLAWAARLQSVSADCGSHIIEQVRRLLPTYLSAPARREVEVQLARIEARQHYHAGDLSAALAAAWRGRYCLSNDQAQDDFNQQLIDWLQEFDDLAAAALLTFESAYSFGARLHPHGRARALTQVALANPQPEWRLALAAHLPANHHPAHVHAATPGTPAGDALAGLRLAQLGDVQHALPLLERAAAHGELVSARLLQQLLHCRILVHGVDNALLLPLPDAASACWSYTFATILDHEGEDLLAPLNLSDERSAPILQQFKHLALRYYQLGLTQFENFFASGDGHLLDGDVRIYSMLCNNLAILSDSLSKRPEQAVELHDKGLAAFALGEHFEGLLRCHAQLKQHTAYINAAECLWRHAHTHVYARHQPLNYIGQVCQALHDLRRTTEIVPWLTRLSLWWQQLPEALRNEQMSAYLSSKILILSLLAPHYPEATVQRLESCLSDLESLGEVQHFKTAGMVYLLALCPQQAELMFNKALSLCPSDCHCSMRTERELHSCLQRTQTPHPSWWQRLRALT